MFYEIAKENLIQFNEKKNQNNLSLIQLIGASAGSGALASFLTSPLDLAKLRLQIQRGTSSKKIPAGAAYSGMMDCLDKAY